MRVGTRIFTDEHGSEGTVFCRPKGASRFAGLRFLPDTRRQTHSEELERSLGEHALACGCRAKPAAKDRALLPPHFESEVKIRANP